jgi:ABC-2 type transport system permease protein
LELNENGIFYFLNIRVTNMIDSFRLYLKFASMSIRGQMQYRASFIMILLGTFTVSFVEFLSISVLFTRFGTLKGWTLGEVALCYGFITASFGFAEGLGRGFDMFSYQVINGEFDRTLLRPRSTALQVLGHEFQLARLGRVLQGVLILVWGSVIAGVDWNPAKVALALFAFSGGVAVFGGLLIMQAAMCFWSTQSLEIMNSFTYGGIEATQWPIPVYNRWFGRLFIYIIPLACVNYFPALAILDKPDVLGSPVWFHWTAPLVGGLFLALALLVWRYGVRHYRSTGS